MSFLNKRKDKPVEVAPAVGQAELDSQPLKARVEAILSLPESVVVFNDLTGRANELFTLLLANNCTIEDCANHCDGGLSRNLELSVSLRLIDSLIYQDGHYYNVAARETDITDKNSGFRIKIIYEDAENRIDPNDSEAYLDRPIISIATVDGKKSGHIPYDIDPETGYSFLWAQTAIDTGIVNILDLSKQLVKASKHKATIRRMGGFAGKRTAA